MLRLDHYFAVPFNKYWVCVHVLFLCQDVHQSAYLFFFVLVCEPPHRKRQAFVSVPDDFQEVICLLVLEGLAGSYAKDISGLSFVHHSLPVLCSYERLNGISLVWKERK